jgi:peptide/bleomycin uptake transporter
MLTEYFCNKKKKTLLLAYFGFAVFIGHHVFMAWMKYALNGWYERFYDTVQVGGSDVGSDSGEMTQHRNAVEALLLDFLYLVAPATIVHPVAGYIRNIWVLHWRIELMQRYLVGWDVDSPTIEGAAQRVHEDTQRFAAGVQACVAALLDSVLTLLVFCPMLYNLNEMLMWIAVGCAVSGILVSATVGHKLVGLEVDNQVAEGALRSQLVVLEMTPSVIIEQGKKEDVFAHCVAWVLTNYTKLYKNFAMLSTWLSVFDQGMTILPYFLVAPLLFADDPAERVTLGVLVKVTNAFGFVGRASVLYFY